MVRSKYAASTLFPGFLLLVVALDLGSMLYSVWEGPFPLIVERGSPTAYLNLYIHVPAAWVSYLLFFLAMIASIAYLRNRDEAWDRRAFAFALVGEAFGVVALVSGAAWASESWGAPWSWDPRQTGVLLLIVAYLGYFALRASIVDPDKMRVVVASYSIAAFSLVPLSFLAAYIQESLHPRASEAGSFLASGNVAAFFVPRVVLATITGLLLSLLLSRGGARLPGNRYTLALSGLLLLLAAVIGSSIALTGPYISSAPMRVTGAGLSGDGIAYLVLSDGSNISFNPPVKAPITPSWAGGSPSIVGHIVVLEGGSITIVRHWSVAFNSALYALLLVALSLAIIRRG